MRVFRILVQTECSKRPMLTDNNVEVIAFIFVLHIKLIFGEFCVCFVFHFLELEVVGRLHNCYSLLVECEDYMVILKTVLEQEGARSSCCRLQFLLCFVRLNNQFECDG